MNKLTAYAALVSLLVVYISLSSVQPVGTSAALSVPERAQTKEEKRRKNFEKAKKLLVDKQVPFDPEILLTPQWRKTLHSTLNQMPELQEKRRGPKRLKNVEMAHTLYLPEKVKLEGDTVLLVRNLIFEGKDAVIRGPFNIFIYPIDEAGVLGTSFDQALARYRRERSERGFRFVNASWTSSRGLPVLPVMREGTITINTSGLGRADWLESKQAMAGRKGRMIRAGFFQGQEQGPEGNENGGSGGDGEWGVEGTQGITGNTGSTGANGTCGNVNGQTGAAGTAGGLAGNGTPGNDGGNGGNAAVIDTDIPDTPQRYMDL